MTRTSLAVDQNVALALNVVRAKIAQDAGHPITVSDTIQELIQSWNQAQKLTAQDSHPESEAVQK